VARLHRGLRVMVCLLRSLLNERIGPQGGALAAG
jgi:hypothetical protein